MCFLYLQWRFGCVAVEACAARWRLARLADSLARALPHTPTCQLICLLPACACRQLYEVLSQPALARRRTPVLLACNKQVRGRAGGAGASAPLILRTQWELGLGSLNADWVCKRWPRVDWNQVCSAWCLTSCPRGPLCSAAGHGQQGAHGGLYPQAAGAGAGPGAAAYCFKLLALWPETCVWLLL